MGYFHHQLRPSIIVLKLKEQKEAWKSLLCMIFFCFWILVLSLSKALQTFLLWLRPKKRKTLISLLLQPAMTPSCIDGHFFCVWLVLGVLVLADVCSAQMAWGGRYHLSCVKKRKVILTAPYTWPHTSFHSTSQCVNETKCFSWSESWQASVISAVWEVDVQRCLMERFIWPIWSLLSSFFCIGETI